MSSLHSYKSMRVAASKGAQAAHSFERWNYLTNMTKRELAEIVCHLAALATDSYDDALASDDVLLGRVREEHDALAANGMI